MAIGDAYATAATYRAIITKQDTSEDAEILTDLKAVSRYLERKLGQFFNVDASAVARLYDGNGMTRLYLDKAEGGVPGISSTTGLTVKVDLNGDYDVTDSGETLTLNTHFWVGPWEAAEGPEARPFRWLELVPSNTVLSAWPKQMRAIEVTATFGWPAVPSAIERACAHLTGILRLESPRATSRIQESLETAIETSREGQRIIKELMDVYGAVVAI